MGWKVLESWPDALFKHLMYATLSRCICFSLWWLFCIKTDAKGYSILAKDSFHLVSCFVANQTIDIQRRVLVYVKGSLAPRPFKFICWPAFFNRDSFFFFSKICNIINEGKVLTYETEAISMTTTLSLL